MIAVFWTTDADVFLDAELECEGQGGEWIITKDLLAEEWPESFECEATNRRRSMGWDAVAYTLKATKLKPALHKFRIYDDDDILYYEGVCTDESFDPLDWARYDSGATRIDYKQPSGEWETL